jgi:formate hydrogenlyase transcriptional activator
MATGPKTLYDAGEERWRAVFENCPLGIAVAEVDGRYLAANAAFQTMLRCTEGELRQMLLTDLTDEKHSPTNRDSFDELVTGERASLQIEKHYRRTDGTSIWLNVSVCIIPGAPNMPRFLMAVVEVITERKGTEEAWRETERRLHAILDNSPNMIFFKDSEGRDLLVYHGGKPSLHVGQEQITPGSDNKAFEVEQAAAFQGSDRQVLDTGAPMEFEVVALHDDGPHTSIVHKFPLRDEQGKIYAIGGIITDITDRRQLQNELQRGRDHLRLVLDLNRSFASNLDLSQLFRSVSAGLRSALRPDVTVLALPELETEEIRIYAMDFPAGKGFLKEGIVYPIEGSVAGRALRTAKPFFFGSPPAWLAPTEQALLAMEGLKSGCALPLIRDGSVLGILSLTCVRENAFTQRDVDLLDQLATHVSVAVENARDHQFQSGAKLAEKTLDLQAEGRRQSRFDEIVGNSRALKRVLKHVETVAATDSAVLILGETGTGKELIARAIHRISSRRDHALVRADCASIPAGLLESELFGHEKGAFTGAIARGIGRVELADKGTLFLDEVGDISLELQSKLLRVLQDQELERLGSTRTIRVNFRLVAATNRDLAQMVERGGFRRDLYYRLNVFPIDVPPLRERPEDIPLLVWHFARKYARRMNKRIETIRSEDMQALARHNWPGNIRELQNVIERSVVLSPDVVLHPPLLAKLKRVAEDVPSEAHTLAEAEREHILHAVRATDWVIGGPHGAAAQLDIRRTTLLYKMRRLGISRPKD